MIIGVALENKDFTTQKAIKDYSWYGKQPLPGETIEISLFFSVPKNVSSKDTVMVLETDFFIGMKTNRETDIVLGKRND